MTLKRKLRKLDRRAKAFIQLVVGWMLF